MIVGFSWWNSPSKDDTQKTEFVGENTQYADTTLLQQTENLPNEKSTANSNGVNNNTVNRNTAINLEPNVVTDSVMIETDLVKVYVQDLGGVISSVNLKNYLTHTKDSLIIFNNRFQEFYLSFFVNKRLIDTKNLLFEIVKPNNKTEYTVEKGDSLTIKTRLYLSNMLAYAGATTDYANVNSKYLEFEYTFYGDNYMIGFNVNFVGLKDVIENRADFIDLHWNADLCRNEKAPNLEDPNTAVYYKLVADDVDYLSETKDDKESFKNPLKWVCFKQQFFSSVLIMNGENMKNADLENYKDKSKDEKVYVKTLKALIGLPYEAKDEYTIPMSLYLGPNKYSILSSYDLDLERLIPLGWSFFLMQWINRFAVIPVFDMLERSGLSYGIVILILTILLKVVLSPITFKSYISSAKMRIMRPEVEAIGKKFPKPEQAMEKQKAVMALYKKVGINQLSGCIPMLLQFPILIAVFRFFPAAIELRQQSFLWADDLSTYDSVLNLPFNIPFYGAHVSLFAILMAATNLLYTRMTMKQQDTGTQMPGMKFMMYVMPIMFLGFLNSYSSALNYYYCISTLITFLITWAIKFSIDENKLRAKMQAHKAKPVKKSKFMARMEELAKQQQSMKK
ncbi:membrane protein insertase YidC [Bacteroidia bacterium]|nr:membrane protein insertase YidC [Bacteroidia bacterium]